MASVACVRVRHGHGERCPGVRAHDVAMVTRRRLVWWSRGKAVRVVVRMARLAWPFRQGGCTRVCSVTAMSRRGRSHGATAAAQNKARDRMAAYLVRSRATARRGGVSEQHGGEAVPCREGSSRSSYAAPA